MPSYAQQIRNQQNRRSQLQQWLNQLRNSLNNLNNRSSQLQRRLSEVMAIRQTVQHGLTGQAEDVSTSQREVARKIESAVTMKGFTEETVTDITNAIESPLPNDSKGSSMIQWLNREITRIQGEIEDVNRSINNTNSQINSANSAINQTNNNIRQLQQAQAREQAQG